MLQLVFASAVVCWIHHKNTNFFALCLNPTFLTKDLGDEIPYNEKNIQTSFH